MTTRRIDRILMALGVVLILISSRQLFFADSDLESGVKLGTLTSTLSVVKTKNALSLDWRDASIGHDLTENQLIYTDNASSAEVVFNEGNTLEINENSLVKLQTIGNEQGMNLSKGFIRAKLESDRPLKVQMNGEDYLLSGKDADIQINLQNEKGEIGVLTGEVKVESAGTSQTINPDSALEINGDKVTKKAIYFKTLTPEKSSTHYVDISPLLVSFSWGPAEEGRVLLSRKPDLDRPLTIEGASGISKGLGPGLWYFKVESDKGTSLVSSFRIMLETPVTVLRPKTGDKVSVLEDEDQVILLQWKDEQRNSYLIEWNDGEIHHSVVSGFSNAVPVKQEGPFSWRIKIQDEKRPLAQWSEWQTVDVDLIARPKVPTDLIPDDIEYQAYDKPNEKIELMWKGEGKVELEVKDPSGKIISKKVNESYTEYVATLAGVYSWRLRGVDAYLRFSEWSDWKTFTVEDLSNEKKAEGVQRIQLKKPDQIVTFNWRSEDGATSVFELSKDSEFKEVVKKVEVNKDSTQVNIPEVGAYYWRSRQYLPDGRLHVSEPKRVIIEPIPAPQKPDKLPDMEIPLEELPLKTTLLQKIIDFLVPSAIAEEVKGIVRLKLPVKEEEKGFVVRIYRDPELKKLVFEEKLTTKEFEWKNAEPGVYYWQYAVIDYWDRRSLFSDPAVLTVKSEFIPLPVQPKLLSPIRAKEIEVKDVILKWRGSENNSRYRVEIALDKNFEKVLYAEEAKKTEASFSLKNFNNGLHYWRVHAYNRKGQEILSNTGRFTIVPELEKTVIEDHPAPLAWTKDWKSRAFLAWAPSSDTYTFEDTDSGEISGTAMMSVLLAGTIFKDKYVFNGELLRQTGEVFEGESYLFQRLTTDAIRILSKNPNHKWGLGLSVGQTSGNAYEIQNNEVKSKSVSGLVYGPIIRNYLSFNKNWEMQGRVQYLLGEIKQMELGADALRKSGGYLLLGGVSYSSREYELNSGKQTSIKVSLGIGKEF